LSLEAKRAFSKRWAAKINETRRGRFHPLLASKMWHELAGRVYAGNIQHVPGFPDEFADCTGFEWDAGNAKKNWELHEVSRGEAEETFFNRPLVVAPDAGHSGRETRFAALGRTEEGRRLTVVFTLRGTSIRVISARDMSRRERRTYEQASTKG
jgi:uncharacterized protein